MPSPANLAIPGVGPVNVEWVREILGARIVTVSVTMGRDITTVAQRGRHVPAELLTAMIKSSGHVDDRGFSDREYLELDHCEVDHAKGGSTARSNPVWLMRDSPLTKIEGLAASARLSWSAAKRRLEPTEHRARRQ